MMEVSIRHLLALPLFVTSLVAFGADCSTGKTQLDINECVAAEYQKADKELNRVYSAYRARLDDQQKQLLKDAQVAWLKYRDLSCKFESADVSGGSAYSMVLQSCLIEKTKARIEDLKKLGNCQEGDLSCPAGTGTMPSIKFR